MDFKDFSCVDFVEVLASKEPVPGGGGASALVAAVGMALGNMVGSLTVGKKKYADVQDEIIALIERSDRLQNHLLDLMQEDAKMFEPLSKAYGLPKETQEEKDYKAKVMEACLKDACAVPLQIMEACCEAIEIIQEFAQKGTALAISDAGVGAIFCRSAVMGASLNVFINTQSMTDREYADSINKKADDMLEKYTVIAENIFKDVRERLK